MSDDAVKEELLAQDGEFKKLYEEHQACESQLEKLVGRPVLSPTDQTEAKRIKLHKLALKDRMESIIRSHALQAAS
ncbi:MAG: DUF465 domain-containing protein [Holophagales bacterium]|nr:DUF465 domain-containing protein [Holophagales bacterium]MXX60760.1 DUF465 domain-containing protein [Holophagales bacterium]MYC11225.1 DUF465 domain-containing protein [Holophagales bacterium]MYD22540.1 DUF465 domain-containing protein [Holophagales bacterium]MYI33996.1 DUF465 domain-containing protein [Holophagales bacterium]